MIDLKLFRKQPDIFIKWSQDKQFIIDFEKFQSLDVILLQTKQKIEDLQNQKNILSKAFVSAKDNIIMSNDIAEKVKYLKQELEILEQQYQSDYKLFHQLYLLIPNPPLSWVPFGQSDGQNIEIAQIGSKPIFDFIPLTHDQILEKANMLDTARAVKISGSRFVILRNDLVRLEFALVQRVLNKLINKWFSPTIVPTIVNSEAMYSTGFLPYGEDQIYKLQPDEDGREMYLVGTSEVPLVAQHSDEILKSDQIPLRYCGFSSCYRQEAGTYGKDMKWMIRVHQFDKVEMVSFVTAQQSNDELEFIRSIEEEIYSDLGIPYRSLSICTGDLGVPAAMKYDLEARFPGLNTYKEVTSCSNCTDFQTRRAKIRIKTDQGNDFLHSLNGTAIALGRCMAAITENYQTIDGKIKTPQCLISYLGKEILG
jgi:seryl-tRNA synthetase